jgi:predicted Rossmann fold nucleotide-binding protein DprA/Smf involved in DNA uptake
LYQNEESIVSVIQQHKESDIDEIIMQNNHLTPSKIASVLLGLELNGVIEALPGKRYRLIGR